jgi:hypothetical protein
MPHPGFNHPDFHGEIVAELEPLRASDAVPVLDTLAVQQLPTTETGGGRPRRDKGALRKLGARRVARPTYRRAMAARTPPLSIVASSSAGLRCP